MGNEEYSQVALSIDLKEEITEVCSIWSEQTLHFPIQEKQWNYQNPKPTETRVLLNTKIHSFEVQES